MNKLSSALAISLLVLGIQTAIAGPIQVQAPAVPAVDFTHVIEKVSPAVVSVRVIIEPTQSDNSAFIERFRSVPELEEFLPDFENFMRRHRSQRQGPQSPRPPRGQTSGSGFFISDKGHIVTNHHVINGVGKAMVKLHDGREFEAEIIGSDEQTDLAVLKIETDETTPYVRFAAGNMVRVGEWVLAVGNPFNFGGTATVGIVSALGREIGGVYADFIQIDASINRGNSGGPTFNLRGEVVGVNTAIVSPTGGSVGIGFAIEADAASRIVSTLMQTGKVTRGWLGVSIQSVTEAIAEARALKMEQGAIVSEVVADSPAEKGGFKRGDIITAINGTDVEDSRDVTRRVGIMAAGSKNRFSIFRDGRTRTISVTIGERPSDIDQAFQDSLSVLGSNLAPLDEDDRKRLSLRKRDRGIIVKSLDRDSPLALAGILVGDALLEANGRILATEHDFREIVEQARNSNRTHLLLAVRKSRRTLFLTVRLDIEDE